MTPSQFEALAALMRLDPNARSHRAARLVLVDGLGQAEAARQTGLTPGGVCNAVRRCRKALRQAVTAARGAR